MTHIVKYKHHSDREVSVRKNLKGKHRDYCLCHKCRWFTPGAPGNCNVAQQLYEVCVDYDLVTPVWECPDFEPNE